MAGVNALIKRLERMAAADVKHRIMQRVTPVVHDECLRGFVEQRDPYGTPWAPRKKIKAEYALRYGHIDDGHPLLDKSGRGIRSLTTRAVGDASQLRMVDYMRFHQSGTYKMVARKMVPEQSMGLGLWTQPVNKAAVDAVRDMCKGRG